MPAKQFTIETLWREENFKPTPNQKDAILHLDGPLYLPAGPGSGKTRVLLWRTLNLIVFHGVSPDEIYLSTFTEKAAHQLKEGLRSLLALATSKNGQPYDLGRMYVGTIHSLCQKLLTDRRFSHTRERPQRPVLMDQLSQYFYVARTPRWGELVDGLGFGAAPEEIHQTINGFLTHAKPGNGSVSKFRAVNNSISFFNRLSEEDFQPEAFTNQDADDNLLCILQMYERYRNLLSNGDGIPQTDFSLLQQEAYHLLKSQNGKGGVFRYVIIDEYQDTNPIQEKLVFQLARDTKNICVVGDDDQALYRFRGATVENFVNFPQKCRELLGQSPKVIPLDTNFRSRQGIVELYSDFISACDWENPAQQDAFFRVPKEIKAHRKDPSPAVVLSKPGCPDDVCAEIAGLVKDLLQNKVVENENQIAFLFPSLKSGQVLRFKEELEKLDLKVYAPRAGRFIEVPEAVSVFGVFLHVFGKPTRGEFPGEEYNHYFDWIDSSFAEAEEIIQSDKNLAQFIADRQAEIATAIHDRQVLLQRIEQGGWSLDEPYDIDLMRDCLITGSCHSERPEGAKNLRLFGRGAGAPLTQNDISETARRNIRNKYFESVVTDRQRSDKPITLHYVVSRATSLDWTVLDLFYRLTAFKHFKAMFDLAERGEDEGPICNMSLISKYLAKFMDEYRSVITADVLQDDRYQAQLFGSYLYTLYRMGESEYEDAEDPFPKGRIPFLTVHQAKGLEFPVVVFGNPRKQVKIQPLETIVQPLLQRQGEPLEKMAQFDFMRLFYVALSRAKNLLVIPHWSSQGNYLSQPLKKMLETGKFVRIPAFDVRSVPCESLEETELSKNYSYTSDYQLYKRCPRQYMVFRKYGFAPSRSQTMFFGSLVHQTLEDLHQYLIAEREMKQ
jgi:DNA helicase II / ATP-dependent DNA helicase PcrA